MVTDTSAESRKVDKKTALALWESAVLPPTVRKKRVDDDDSEAQQVNGHGTMKFTVITKRGNKQHVSIFTLFFLFKVEMSFFRLDNLQFLRRLPWPFTLALPRCKIKWNNNI
jgi:hypothetical protein